MSYNTSPEYDAMVAAYGYDRANELLRAMVSPPRPHPELAALVKKYIPFNGCLTCYGKDIEDMSHDELRALVYHQNGRYVPAAAQR